MKQNDKENDKDFPIYCIKDVAAILHISVPSIHRLKKEAGFRSIANKRKTRYTMSEIELLAEFINLKNKMYYEKNVD